MFYIVLQRLKPQSQKPNRPARLKTHCKSSSWACNAIHRQCHADRQYIQYDERLLVLLVLLLRLWRPWPRRRLSSRRLSWIFSWSFELRHQEANINSRSNCKINRHLELCRHVQLPAPTPLSASTRGCNSQEEPPAAGVGWSRSSCRFRV